MNWAPPKVRGGQALLLKRSDFSHRFFVSIFCKKSFDIVLRNDYELVVQMSGNTPQKYLEEKKKKKIPENPQNQQKCPKINKNGSGVL